MLQPIYLVLVCIIGVATSPIKHEDYRENMMEKNNDACSGCQQVIGTIHMALARNETKEEIQKYLKDSCSLLDGMAQVLCSTVMDIIAKTLVDDTVGYLSDPLKFCSLVKFCKSREQKNQYPYHERVMERFEILSNPRATNSVNNKKCYLCEFIMSIIQMIMLDKPTQDFVHEYTRKMCNIIPNAQQKECQTLIDAYEPQLYLSLAKGYFNPMVFCPKVGAC